MSDKYAVIAAHRREFHVTMMCRVLAVSPSGFHAAQKRALSARTKADVVLLGKVRATHTKSRQRYGSPRITRQLRRAGERVSAKKVARMMRAEGLAARERRRFVVTTNSTHGDPIAPNLLAREFAVGPPRACNTIWASDISVPQQAA